MADNSRAINRVFTRGVIGGLLQTGSNEVFDYVVQRYINDPESKTHGQIISEIYAYLGYEQRNEYYYMNTLLNKLLVRKHNVNTTTALSQVRIGRHIADFVMINGEANVYEIKSNLDNFVRLRDQLGDYYRAFSKVSVLSSPQEFDKIERILMDFGDMGKAVGIYILSDHNTIFRKTLNRLPAQFDDYLDHSCIFKLLRKREYENALIEYYGEIPQVVPVAHFRTCLELFRQIPILEAQQLAFRQLKKRNKIKKVDFEKVQVELKTVVYFSDLLHKLPKLEYLLQKDYRR